MIANASGKITSESDYYPWGGELQFVNNDPNHFKYTGKEHDSETALDYFGARYYSNWLGRWISADWSATPVPVPYADFWDPQTLNLYQFVGGNPVSKSDLDGHDWPSLSDIGNLIVGAGNAYGSDFFLGAGRVDSDNEFYQAGQAIGDGVLLIHSAGETEIGIAGDIVGIPLIPAAGSGLVVEAVSVGVTAHGAARGAVSTVNLGKAVISAFSHRAGDFKPSTREQAIQNNAQQNGGTSKCEKCGQTLVRTPNKKGKTPLKISCTFIMTRQLKMVAERTHSLR